MERRSTPRCGNAAVTGRGGTTDGTMIALMVEDSALVRGRLIPMLAAFSGVRVVATAESAAEAIDWLGANRCDLVLLDLSLRGDSGLDILDALGRRRTEPLATQPLRVVLTNGADDVVRRHCEALGAHAVFDKSIQLDELFAFLRHEHCTLH
jgi:two-component system OmpR family response regulator